MQVKNESTLNFVLFGGEQFLNLVPQMLLMDYMNQKLLVAVGMLLKWINAALPFTSNLKSF